MKYKSMKSVHKNNVPVSVTDEDNILMNNKSVPGLGKWFPSAPGPPLHT